MEREKQMQTPAGRESQQNQSQGGVAMRRYLWSTVDAGGRLVPYVVLECSEEIAEEIEDLGGEGKWMFIAEKLHEKYPDDFPSWFDEFDRRRIYWYNNVLESYEEAYDRVVGEIMEALREYYDDEEALLEVAKIRAEEELNNLPVIKI